MRIARELHDVVAHTMSVVAVHAGTGRMVADDDPAAARQALATIETTTRSALVEMRRMLGVLRGSGDEPGALRPAPGLGDLDALVADVVQVGRRPSRCGWRANGPTCRPASICAAYRIVQEALTNVIKHAGQARATVVVRYSDDAVTVEVDDEGRAAASRDVVGASTGGARPGGHARACRHVRRRPRSPDRARPAASTSRPACRSGSRHDRAGRRRRRPAADPDRAADDDRPRRRPRAGRRGGRR